jgi:hypothetical protein
MTQKDQFLAFIARLCLVLLFPFSALNKIFDHQAAMAQAAQGWIPLEEDQPKADMLVVGRLEVFAQLVGGEKQLRLEAEVGSVPIAFRGRGLACAMVVSRFFRAPTRHRAPPLSSAWCQFTGNNQATR